MAANKSDLYEQEEVTEKEGKEYAKEIGAIFKSTSAVTGIGISELFTIIGKKLYNPNFKESEEGDDDNGEPKEFEGFVVCSRPTQYYKLDRNTFAKRPRDKRC